MTLAVQLFKKKFCILLNLLFNSIKLLQSNYFICLNSEIISPFNTQTIVYKLRQIAFIFFFTLITPTFINKIYSNPILKDKIESEFDAKLTIKNEGNCPATIYWWVSTGDQYYTTIQAGQSWVVDTWAGHMWRATNGNWNNLIFDEHYTALAGNQTWVIKPTYCCPSTLSQHISVDGAAFQNTTTVNVCRGQLIVLDFCCQPSNTTYTFKRPDGAVFAGGTNGVDPDQIRFNADGINVGTWVATYTQNGCSKTASFVVNVKNNDLPQYISVDNAAFQNTNNVTVCKGQLILLDFNGEPANTTYTFKRPDGAVFPGGTNGVSPDQIRFNADGVNIGKWEATYVQNGCPRTAFFTISLNSVTNAGQYISGIGGQYYLSCSAPYDAPVIETTPATCTSGTPNYQWQIKTDAVNGTWQNISGATEKNYDPPIMNAGSVWYRRVAICGSCMDIAKGGGGAEAFDLHIRNPINVVTESNINDAAWLPNNLVTVCAGSKLILSANPNGAVSYKWTGPNGFSGLGNTNGDILVSNAITSAQAGNYTVEVSSDLCKESKIITVNVNDLNLSQHISVNGGTFQNTNTVTVCKGQLIVLDFCCEPANTTYTFKRPDGAVFPGGTNGVSPDQIRFNADGVNIGTWEATYTQNGCSKTVKFEVKEKFENPIGYVDNISDKVYGWAFDPSNPSASIDLHIYVRDAITNNLLQNHVISTNLLRSDVNSTYGITGNHGYSFDLLPQYCGRNVKVEVYGINIGCGNANTLLTGSGGTYQLPILPNLSQHISVDGAAFQNTNTVTVCKGQLIVLDFCCEPTNTTYSFKRPDGVIFAGGTNGVAPDQILFGADGVNIGTWEATYTQNGCSKTVNFTINTNSVTNTGQYTSGIGGQYYKGCAPFDPPIIQTTAATCTSGTPSYQWQIKTDPNGNWQNILGATGKDYDPPIQNASSLWLRRVAICGSCTAITTASSNGAEAFDIHVRDVSPGIVLPATGSACGINTTIPQLTLSGQTGKVVRWEYKRPSEEWSNWGGVGSNTNPSGSFSLLGEWRFRAIVVDNEGFCEKPSAEAVWQAISPSVGGIVSPATQSITILANGIVPIRHTLSGHVGNIIRWEFQTPNSTTWNNWNGSGSITAPNNCCFNTVGTWKVRAIVNNGCGETPSSEGLIIVTDPCSTPINATITGANEVCSNTTTTITASGGSSYRWNTGATTASISAGVGTYTVTVSNITGCSVIATKTIASKLTTISVANCPQNINLIATTNNCAIATWTAPTFTSNCGILTVTSTHNPGFCFPVGTTTVTYTATVNGISKTCTFAITVTPPPLGSIGDFTYCDNNSNGIFDTGDTPIGGVQVTLCNANNAIIATTTTDIQGKYLFANLVSGFYIVKFPATITGGKIISTNNPITVNLGSGQKYLDADAGYKNDCATNPINATITGENSVCRNTTTTLTAVGGNYYKWSNGATTPSISVGVGTYSLTVTNIAGCSQILTKNITTTTTFINVNNCPQNINLTANTTNCAVATWTIPTFTSNCGNPVVLCNYNPGYCFPIGTTTVTYSATLNGVSKVCSFTVTVNPAPKGSIGDYVFKDNNSNGIQDLGDSPLSGVFIQLKNSSGSVIASTVSNTNGQYFFTNLVAGTYQVCFTTPSGCQITTKGAIGSNVTNDSDIDNNGNSSVINLGIGENITTIDAGYKPLDNASLGDRVWEDTNGNGIQDGNEIGVPNITVFLIGTTLNGITINKSTVTNSVGQYLFSNLPTGSYKVSFAIPNTYLITAKDKGTNDDIDSDIESGTNTTGIYILTNGQSNLTVDAGIYRPACIGDFVFVDTNKNGLQDVGEIGYANVPIILNGVTNNGININLTTTSNQNGIYKFNNLAPGIYCIQIITPNGYALTLGNQGVNDAIDSDIDPSTGKSPNVPITSGQNYLLLDVGIYNKFNNSCSGDIIPPVFSNIPNNLTIECGATFNMPLPSVSDNCSATSNIQLNFTDTETNGTCPIKKTITRTWKATDQSGNTTTVSRTITVIDTKAPIITGTPNDITIQCGQSIPLAPGYGVNGVQAFDDCEGNITNKVTFSEVIFAGTCVSNTTSNGKSKMVCTWTIKDVCGNISSKPWNITINSSASTSRSNNNNDDNDNIDNIEIFPNPNNGNFVVKVSDLFINELSIFDVSGKKVYQKVLNQHQQLINIDLSELNLGMYFLYLNTPEKRITKKIIVN